jgi:hypothetical protein
MLENARLFGTPRDERRIVVQTRSGTDLENFVGAEATYQCQQRFAILCRYHGRNWSIRKSATGGYNCAGLLWSSRRAALPDPQQWWLIIREDGYRELSGGEAPQVGDIALYLKKGDENKEILHVARICEVRQIATDRFGSESGRPIPRALSKWDLTSGECIHALPDVFLNGGEPFQTRIFTDRPQP